MKKINLSVSILEENYSTAKKIRRYLKENDIFCINIMGSPGCGKTTFIETLIRHLKKDYQIAVIEGDIATAKDAKRIERLKIPVVLINTETAGNACHLNSRMIFRALKQIKNKTNILFIENIGNLVCPAEFDLGENMRIVMISVPEGDDKVSKYPPMFAKADTVMISKIDMLKYFNFNLKKVNRDIKTNNPDADIFKYSVKDNKLIKSFAGYLESKIIK